MLKSNTKSLNGLRNQVTDFDMKCGSVQQLGRSKHIHTNGFTSLLSLSGININANDNG